MYLHATVNDNMSLDRGSDTTGWSGSYNMLTRRASGLLFRDFDATLHGDRIDSQIEFLKYYRSTISGLFTGLIIKIT